MTGRAIVSDPRNTVRDAICNNERGDQLAPLKSSGLRSLNLSMNS